MNKKSRQSLFFITFAVSNFLEMKITSKTETVNAVDYKIYNMACNCNNFGKFLPEQIKDWESTEEYCQFTIPGITTLRLSITEKIEYSKIVYHASNDKNIPIVITLFIIQEGQSCRVEAEINAEIPIFLHGMVKKPLQNLVDLIVDKIKIEAEK